jgi:hypothetical protein
MMYSEEENLPERLRRFVITPLLPEGERRDDVVATLIRESSGESSRESSGESSRESSGEIMAFCYFQGVGFS